MSRITTDIAIIGAGMAGASLAAFAGDRAEIVLIEAESQPGYHSTGRSAAFWSESYGGPKVQPLTTASGVWLAERGLLRPRGCIHLADGDNIRDRLTAELDACGVERQVLDREQLVSAIPGLAPAYTSGVAEPTCQDIDVGALHGIFLGQARAAGAKLLCDAGVLSLARDGGCWQIETRAGAVTARVVVNAAGAWSTQIGEMAGARSIGIQPYRRTIVQLSVDPPVSPEMPLIMDGRGHFYFRPEAGGKLWLSPHDESPVIAHDVAPEELDQAIAIDRLEKVVDWRIVRRERAWAGLRSFTPDRVPLYGFDPDAPDFFWCAGQGGFGIQTAPAAGMLAASLLLGSAAPTQVAHIDPAVYAPDRFGHVAG